MLRSSSCIVLTTLRLDQVHVFWSMRQPYLDFLGGFHAFMGGAMEEADRQWHTQHQMAMGDYLACAARELFEEAGVLALKDRLIWSGQSESGESSYWQAQRHQCIDDPSHFYDILTRHELDVDRYHPVGRWVTPSWAPLRFETEFFQLHITPQEFEQLGLDALGQTIQAQELCHAEWIDVQTALNRFDAGDVFLTTPAVHHLQHLSTSTSPDRLEAVDQDDIDDVLFHHRLMKDTYAVPLKSPTLAPATHTNCYLIAGQEGFVIVDPGSKDARELAHLYEVIDALIATKIHFEAIVLTHHHIDHISGVRAVQARYNTPVWAHANTARQVADEPFDVAEHLEDLSWIELGSRRLQVLETFGHASGHVALVDERSDWVFVGDVVASFGTILVNPPDGHMGQYLASLERLKQGQHKALLPAHGWLIGDADGVLSHYHRHRLAREQKVLDALKAQPGATASSLVAVVYDDAPMAVWPIATLSLQAHLEHLVEIGQASLRQGRFSAT